MNRGAAKRPVFTSRRHERAFLGLLEAASRIYAVEVHGFCLMHNHYHLLLKTPRAGLGKAMRHVNGLYAQRFNKSEGIDGPLFRGRYKSILVSDDRYLLQVSRYIHLNPVNAGIVRTACQYRASSYRSFIGVVRGPQWLHTGPILEMVGGGRSATSNYRRFVEEGIDKETRAFYERARLPPVFGSEKLRQHAVERSHETPGFDHPEVSPVRLLVPRPSILDVAIAVCRAFSLSLSDVREPPRPRTVERVRARAAIVYLSRRVGGHPLNSIAAWLGAGSYKSASKSVARLKNRLRRDGELRRRVRAAERTLEVAPRQREG